MPVTPLISVHKFQVLESNNTDANCQIKQRLSEKILAAQFYPV
jgi:hypothetical protein